MKTLTEIDAGRGQNMPELRTAAQTTTCRPSPARKL